MISELFQISHVIRIVSYDVSYDVCCGNIIDHTVIGWVSINSIVPQKKNNNNKYFSVRLDLIIRWKRFLSKSDKSVY